MPSRRLFDSTALTPPPEPRVEAVNNNLMPGDEDVVFVTAGIDVAHGYDPTRKRGPSPWPPVPCGPGFTPERQPFPAIACALDFLNDIIKDTPPPPPGNIVDAIMRRLCVDGEAFIRMGGETYRITDLGGRFRCELVEKERA